LQRDGLERFAGDIGLNTDDNMRIEYSAPLHLHEHTATSNFNALVPVEDGVEHTVPIDAVEGVDGRIALAEAYARRTDWLRALVTLRDAYRLQPDHPQVVELYESYQDRLREKLQP